jgi:hypothetical protein
MLNKPYHVKKSFHLVGLNLWVGAIIWYILWFICLFVCKLNHRTGLQLWQSKLGFRFQSICGSIKLQNRLGVYESWSTLQHCLMRRRSTTYPHWNGCVIVFRSNLMEQSRICIHKTVSVLKTKIQSYWHFVLETATRKTKIERFLVGLLHLDTG